MKIPLIKGTKVAKNAIYRDVLPVNAIYVPKPENPNLHTAPGLSRYAVASGVDRGGIYFESDQLKGHFRVSGGELVELVQGVSGPEISVLGEISGNDQAVLIYTLTNLVITTDRKQWLYNRDDGLRAVDDEDLGQPIDSTWINAKIYDLSFDPVTTNTYIVQHEINKDEEIETSKYSTSDISPDVPYGLAYVTGNQIAIFNRHTIEFFYDAGGTGFTLQRQESRTIDGGVIGTRCKCRFMGSFAVLGGRFDQSINFFVMSGTGLSPIGTNEVQLILEQYTEHELRSVLLESRSEKSHEFLIAHLPKHTLMFDAQTKQWCILKTGLYDSVYRAINGVFDPRYKGGWIYGDKTRGDLATLDYSTFLQYGQQQEMILYSAFRSAPNRIIKSAELDVQYEVVNSEHEPRLFLSATQDGRSYSVEKPYNLNMMANYRRRLLMRKIGRVKNKVSFKIRLVTPNPTTLGESMEAEIV